MINKGSEISNQLNNRIIYTVWPKVDDLAWRKVKVKTSVFIDVELRERVLNSIKQVIIKNMEV